MNKTRSTITVGLIVGFMLLLLPGCMIVGSRDEFAHRSSEKETTGEFVPDFYIQKNTLRIPIPLFRFEIDRLPHSLVMLQYDPTYLNTDAEYQSFVVDKMQVQYSDGTTVDCIRNEDSIANRTFEIPKSMKSKCNAGEHTFGDVIVKNMDFSIETVGTAIKIDGTRVPFRHITRYSYNGKTDSFHTIFDEWASC